MAYVGRQLWRCDRPELKEVAGLLARATKLLAECVDVVKEAPSRRTISLCECLPVCPQQPLDPQAPEVISGVEVDWDSLLFDLSVGDVSS